MFHTYHLVGNWMFRITDTFKIVTAEKINFKQTIYICIGGLQKEPRLLMNMH